MTSLVGRLVRVSAVFLVCLFPTESSATSYSVDGCSADGTCPSPQSMAMMQRTTSRTQTMHDSELVGKSSCDEAMWPDVDHGVVCGECRVLVANFKSKYQTCQGYCRSIGRECTGAWDEKGSTCSVQFTATCDTRMDQAYCACGSQATPGSTPATAAPSPTPATGGPSPTEPEPEPATAAPSPTPATEDPSPTPATRVPTPPPTPPFDGTCDTSSWPDIKSVCGECKVFVNNFKQNYKTCSGYCFAVGRACVSAWDDGPYDSCEVYEDMTCETRKASNDASCECGDFLPPTPAPTGGYIDDKISAVEYDFFLVLNKFRAEGFTCSGGERFPPNPKPMIFDCRLWKAAQLHSQDMADKDFFGHYSSNGDGFTTRSEKQGIKTTGEICAKGSSKLAAGGAALFHQWQGSPGHCSGMGNPENIYMGAGYGHNPEVGPRTHLWTVVFRSNKRSLLVDVDDSCLPPLPPVPTPAPTAPVPTPVTAVPSDGDSRRRVRRRRR